MYAVISGSTESVRAMTDLNRSVSVTIDICAQDDNGNTAFDYAVNLGNAGGGNQNTGKSKSGKNASNEADSALKSLEIQGLLENYGGGTEKFQGTTTPSPGDECAIELTDMSNQSHLNSYLPLQPRSLPGSFGKSNVKPSGVGLSRDVSKPRNLSSKSVSQLSDSSEGEIQKWAKNVKNQHEAAGRVAALTPVPGNSQKKADVNTRSKSSLSVHQATYSRRPSVQEDSSKPEPDAAEVVGDDEDVSLSDLLSSVRQYAQEIKEIYEPIKQEGEERLKRRKDWNWNETRNFEQY